MDPKFPLLSGKNSVRGYFLPAAAAAPEDACSSSSPALHAEAGTSRAMLEGKTAEMPTENTRAEVALPPSASADVPKINKRIINVSQLARADAVRHSIQPPWVSTHLPIPQQSSGQQHLQAKRRASDDASALLKAFLNCSKVEMLNKPTKDSLRLCNKGFKRVVDATVASATMESDNLSESLNALISNTEWYGLEQLQIAERNPSQSPNPLRELPSALFVKFSRLEYLGMYFCPSLKALPEEIGALSHLKVLDLDNCDSLVALPTSLGKLTTLEKVTFTDCSSLTMEGIAPLQHLTGLTSLTLAYCQMFNYPDFVGNFAALRHLRLVSRSIDTLPKALGNLTNLESLTIRMENLEKLPESFEDLSSLTKFNIINRYKFTTLPESLDALLWRQAHQEGMELVIFF